MPFCDGFNVLTGESGAGKSLMMKAIRFALGAKCNRKFIGPESDSMEVCLDISLQKPLKGLALPQILRIEHQLSKNKRSVKVNGEITTQAVLQKIADQFMLDCFQHAEQALKSPEEQLKLVDALLPSEVLSHFQSAMAQDKNIQQQFTQVQKDMASQDELETLQYYINELQEHDLSETHINDLMSLVDAGKAYKQLSQKVELLDAQLHTSRKSAVEIMQNADCETHAPGLNDSLHDLVDAVDQASQQITAYLSSGEEKRFEIGKAKETLNILQGLARKHQVGVSQLATMAENLSDKIRQINESSEKYHTLASKCERTKVVLKQASDALFKAREASSESLSSKVTTALALIGLQNATFRIVVDMQGVKFEIKLNQAAYFQPIDKGLSGGELSRLNLIIRVLSATQPFILLDEVDTGLSGDAANKVRAFLKSLSSKHQLLAITHLAAVAAGADQHFLVTKSEESVTTVKALDQSEVVDEVSRLMGGSKTQAARLHAQECIAGTDL